MSEDAFILEVCRGARGLACPFALPLAGNLPGRLEAAVWESGWPELLRARQKPIRRHHALKLSLSACANGCSRPHIADFGLIAARRPAIRPERCTGCDLCRAACPEGSVASGPDGPAIDRAACLGCGRCVAACPEGALTAGQDGFRVLTGGRLGRRPRLALELAGLASQDQALNVLARLLGLVCRDFLPNDRPAARLFEPKNRAATLAELEEEGA